MALSPNRLHGHHGTGATAQLGLGENAAASRSTVGPTAAQWEMVKEEIRKLYQLMPLKDVRKVMEQRHKFKATERMYKARLALWKFNKNSNDKEYQICAILHKRRRDLGKRSSLFHINGNKRTLKDLRKYIKGRKMTSEEFLDTAIKNVSLHQLETQRQVRAVTPTTDSASQEDLDQDRDGDVEIGVAGMSRAQANAFDMGPTPPADSKSPLAFSPDHHNRHSFLHSPTHNHSSVNADFSHFGTHLPSPNPRHLLELQPPSRPRKRQTLTTGFGLSQSPLAPIYTDQRQQHLSSNNNGFLAIPNATTSPDMQLTDSSSPSRDRSSTPCQYLNVEIDRLGHQTLYSGNLGTVYGADDLDSWWLLSPSPSGSTGMDHTWEQVCPQCHDPTSSHFASLQNWDTPPSIPQFQLPTPATTATTMTTPALFSELPADGLATPSPMSRCLFHSTPDLPSPGTTIPLPASAKEHDHSWRWVSRCFLACIILSSHIPGPSPSSSPPTPSQKERAASEVLQCADVELAAMLRQDDPKTILALNQTLVSLHMHDQGAVSRRIIASAANVAIQVLGSNHPTTVIVRWMVFVAEPKVLLEQREITSLNLREAYDYFVRIYGEKDRRSLGAMYALGFMLNVEGQLGECECVLKRCYDLCCEVLGNQNFAAITAITNLRLCLEKQGKLEEAIQAAQIAIRDSIETLGKSHPRRLETMRLLGAMYKAQGKLELCEKIYWEVLQGRVKSLGKSHRFTRGMKRDLIELLREMNKWWDEDAEDWEAEEQKCEAAMQIKLLWEWDPFDRWIGVGVAMNGTREQNVSAPADAAGNNAGGASMAERMSKRQTAAF